MFGVRGNIWVSSVQQFMMLMLNLGFHHHLLVRILGNFTVYIVLTHTRGSKCATLISARRVLSALDNNVCTYSCFFSVYKGYAVPYMLPLSSFDFRRWNSYTNLDSGPVLPNVLPKILQNVAEKYDLLLRLEKSKSLFQCVVSRFST